MANNYTYATLADAQNALAARLYNTSNTQWTLAELQVYIVEALRTWNAITSFWRAEFTFNLSQGINWYDIPSQSQSLRRYTVTDQYLTNTLEYHLLEPLTTLSPNPSVPALWTGSGQFTLADIYGAITRRQNDTLGASGCTITRGTINAPIQRTGMLLSDTTLDIRRIAWIPVENSGYDTNIMRQADAWAKMAFDSTYTTNPQGVPATWLQSTEPPPRFDVDRVPPVPGSYETLTVNAGANAVSTAANALSVPDDWSWVVKWGALSDLLGKESTAKDAFRAQYCLQRYEQGLKMMAVSPAVLSLQLNGQAMNIDAVKNGDDFNSGWESLTQGAPNVCYAAGLNLIGFNTPNSGTYSALLTVVENAPVPSNSGDYIQVSRNDYDAILDYAQHLGAFKLGGAEFASTFGLLQNFMNRAALYNGKLKTMGQFESALYGLSQREGERRPRVEVGR